MAESVQTRKHSRDPFGQGRHQPNIVRKRTTDNRRCYNDETNDGEESDTDGDGNDFKRRKNAPSHSQQMLKWYACPFHKHDPEYFSSNKATRMRFKSCGSKGWTEICRLKEHLYRVHKDPPKCDKCQKVFLRQDLLKTHLRDQNNADCKWMPEIPSKGISSEVVAELRKRKKHTMTDEGKWFNIWQLLFPNEKIPVSPYSNPCETSDSLDDGAFHEYLNQKMPRLFKTKLNAALDGIGLTREQKKMVRKLSTALESSLRQQLWESYFTGPNAENDLLVHESDKHEFIGSTSISMQNEAFEFEFEFDQNYFDDYQEYGLDLIGSSEYQTTNNSEYHPHQFSYSQSLENTRLITPSPSFCIAQPSTSAKQPSLSSNENELVPERSLPARTNCINPTQLMVAPIANLPHSRTCLEHPSLETQVGERRQHESIVPAQCFAYPLFSQNSVVLDVITRTRILEQNESHPTDYHKPYQVVLEDDQADIT